jgi:hypothetical protein
VENEMRVGLQVQTLAQLMDLKDAVMVELRKSLHGRELELLDAWIGLHLAVEDTISEEERTGTNLERGPFGRLTAREIENAQRLLSKS